MSKRRSSPVSLNDATWFIRSNETVTVRQFREHFDCSKDHARKILRQLLARGIVDYKIIPQGFLYFACDTEDWTSPY